MQNAMRDITSYVLAENSCWFKPFQTRILMYHGKYCSDCDMQDNSNHPTCALDGEVTLRGRLWFYCMRIGSVKSMKLIANYLKV